MHFHLPKPIHGWREFFGEVGIIVVGVLIALGAEQLVETAHLRNELGEAQHQIRREVSQAAAVFEERQTVQPCLDRRLSQLAMLLSSARKTGRLPDVGEIGRPPTRPIQSAAWSTATAKGFTGKLGDKEQEILPVYYSQGTSYSEDVQAEQEMWATLRLLEHSAGPIDGPLLAQAVTTLERVRFKSWLNGVNAEQLLDSSKQLGIAPDYYLIAETGERFDRSVLLQRVAARPICHPLQVDGKAFPS